MNEILEFTNDFTKFANENGMNVTLRSPSEGSLPGTRKFLQKTNPKLTPFSVGTIGKENGNCSTKNRFLNIKIKKDQIIEFKKLNIDVNDVEKLKLKKGSGDYFINDENNIVISKNKKGDFKFFSVSSYSRNENKNIAPTITHEAGHAIQFQFDPQLNKFNQLFTKNKLQLIDAPTIYGESNKYEFWTESFTYYVYDNDGLKKRNPKVFDFVEEYLKEINVDLKTIKIAK